MVQRTNILLSVAASGPFSGHWFQVPRDDGRANRSVIHNLSAGTGTVKLEGRNSPGETGTTIATLSTSALNSVQYFPQMRVTSADAAGATVKVTMDIPCKDTGS
jgi:hypothetical protein